MSYWRDVRAMTIRALTHYRARPELIIFDIVFPVMFVLLFDVVFGGAIQTGQDYTQYMLPGVFIGTVLFTIPGTAVGFAEDLHSGMLDRFRSLPMSPSALLLGRSISDAIRTFFITIIMIIVGYMLGFRFMGSFAQVLGLLAICVAFGFIFSWMAMRSGLSSPSIEAAQSSGMIWIMPAAFLSSIYAPPETMPRWIRGFVEHQPVSVLADVVRDLSMGHTNTGQILLAVVWIVVLFGFFLFLCLRAYNKLE